MIFFRSFLINEKTEDILFDFCRAKIPHCIANVLSGYGYCIIFVKISVIFLFAAKYPNLKPANPNALESVRTTIRLSYCLTRLTTDESENSAYASSIIIGPLNDLISFFGTQVY